MGSKERKIVVDTNVLISSLINSDSIVWEVLGLENVNFFVPEIAVEEVEKYEELIKDKLKSRERRDEYKYLLSELFSPIVVVPSSLYRKEVQEAYEVMKGTDEKDTEFLALAMFYDSPIWSDNSDFQDQDIAEVYTSEEIIEKLL